jgi:hypothetical protein
MATFNFEFYCGAGPGWADMGSATQVFCGSLTDLTAPVSIDAFQDGTHLGSGDPGTDQCGANHVNNVKYLTDTTMSVNGGGSETLNDANLAEAECTLRIKFSDASAVVTTAARFYTFNGTVVTVEAEGVVVYAYERGVAHAGGWTKINDDVANIGGDNSGERLDLADQAAPATTHYFYLAMSVAAQSVGSKGNFDMGVALTYS